MRRSYPRWDTSGWKDGDPVSQRIGELLISGYVVQLKRNSDGQPFLMVRISAGGRIGDKTWPDGFLLGHGHIKAYCPGCQRHFHTTDREQDFCLACDRHARGTESIHETRSIGGTLRGARTPIQRVTNTATAEEIAADLKARDDATPF